MDAALKQFATLCETIRRERFPLTQEQRRLQADVREERRRATCLGIRQENIQIDLDTLKAEVQDQSAEVASIRNQFDTFNHTLHSLAPYQRRAASPRMFGPLVASFRCKC